MAGSAEVLVERLRNRRRRLVVGGSVLVLALGVITVFAFSVSQRPQQVDPQLQRQDPAMAEIVRQQIETAKSLLELMTMVMGAVFVLTIVLLVTAFSSYTKDDLLVELWDRVQALEQSNTPEPNPDASDLPNP